MVSQHGGGEKENWEVASVRGLHGPQYGLSQGPLSYTKDQLVDAIVGHPQMSF